MTKETVDSLGFEFPDPAMVLTYYPGKAEEADATLVDVEEGKVVENVDFRIQPSQRGARHKVSGKLISRTGFSGRRITDLYLVPRFRGKPKDTPTHSNGGAFATAQLNAAFRSDATSFDFAFGDVREGAYDLFIETGRSSGEDCCDVVARLALNVYGDIDGLIVEAGGVDVRGRIVQRDGASVGPAVSVSLALVPEDIRTRNVKPGASGEFTMPAVLPGAWKVLASGLPPEFTVFDIRQKDESVVDGGVVVTDRSAEPFEVILTAAGSVEGSVRGAEGAAIIGADVVLIPTGANETRTALYRRARSDGAGRFSVASVGMGDYAALAFRRGLLPSDAVSGPSLKSFAAPYLPLAIAISVRPGAPTSLTVPVAQQPVDPR
jgi:hypothetical protein